ncbi:hypothetical protein [Streptomyces sp. NPDC020742]|uniref:hypothetical protein n=1 Tax=Streptomyces sp. NPDC020742 TaxID=3154897 RepID=UPI0033CC62ED
MDQPGTDIHPVDGKPQDAASGTLTLRFLAPFVGYEVRADKSNVLTPEREHPTLPDGRGDRRGRGRCRSPVAPLSGQ